MRPPPVAPEHPPRVIPRLEMRLPARWRCADPRAPAIADTGDGRRAPRAPGETRQAPGNRRTGKRHETRRPSRARRGPRRRGRREPARYPPSYKTVPSHYVLLISSACSRRTERSDTRRSPRMMPDTSPTDSPLSRATRRTPRRRMRSRVSLSSLFCCRPDCP